mgnify:CR=1 FL=1
MEIKKSILITGASNGIGAALAKEYATNGNFLAISGRNAERLNTIAEECRNKGAIVENRVLDVMDTNEMSKWVSSVNSRVFLDLVIANAGIAGGVDGAGRGPSATHEIFRTNINGVINTVLPSLEVMEKRGQGQIAIMSSLAAFRGIPSTPAYSATKAAVKVWGEGLRTRHAGNGIKVSVICPGFVQSGMTKNNPFPMPLIISSKKAAKIIRKGLEKNTARIAFPRRMYFLAWLLGVLPPSFSDRLIPNIVLKE